MLTCRLPGLEERSPVRVVLDRRLRLPPESRLARSAGEPAAVAVHAATLDGGRGRGVAGRGRHAVPGRRRRIRARELHEMLAVLADQGITRLLVEGGAPSRHGLPARGLVDRLYLFDAPLLIGADGQPAIHSLAVRRLGDARRWRRVEERLLGADRLACSSRCPRQGEARMFTGIVTHLGEIAAVREMAGGRELVVASDLPLAELALGRLGRP